MTSRSRKNKGRRAVLASIKVISEELGIDQNLLSSTPSGVNGVDILIDSSIRHLLPFSIEVKNQERLNIPSWWEQTLYNAGKYHPLLIFKRNYEKERVMLLLETCKVLLFDIEKFKAQSVTSLTWEALASCNVIYKQDTIILPLTLFLKEYKMLLGGCK